ncbi:MAG: hypothetical protein CYG59_12465 [Chloroflexi bacterium]|nr:MAG: hypothetical protein CYG59_12465 [Chloroflexota bacterium]
MASQTAHLSQRHEAAQLPGVPRFRHLDSLLIALDEQPRQLGRRWIERAVPAFMLASHQNGGR